MNHSRALAVAIGIALAPVGACLAQNNSSEPVDEIIVEGQKIKRSLQDTKESVAVYDQDWIQSQRLFDLRELFNQTANAVELFNGEDFGIRGVTASSASTGGGTGELASLFYDGVALTGFARRFGPRGLWDIEQVEILRGPQSTNVGRNALIGAVIMTSRAPDSTAFDAAVRLEAGDFGKAGFEGMINMPLTENSALRITAETFHSDGFTENVTIPEENYDERDNQTFRARYLYTPSDRLSIGINAQYAKTERGQQIYRADLNADIEDRINRANLQAREDFEAWSGSLNVDFTLNDRWSVLSVTAFLDGEYDRFDDDDESEVGGNAFRGREGLEDNWSQELRFTYQGERLNGVAGLWYTEVDVVNDTTGLVNLAPADLGVPAALLPFYPTVLEIDAFIPAENNRVNYAFFTEWDYQVSDSWTLSTGLRYDYEEQDNLSNNLSTLAPGSELPDPVAAGMAAEVIQPGLGPTVEAGVAQVNALLNSFLVPDNNPVEQTDYEAFLPQLGATYTVNDDVSVSAFFKRGYRSGGSEVSLTGDIADYDPEYLNNYEVSLRSVFLDGSFVFNANAYYGDWTDQQVSSCPFGPLSCITTNAGESEIFGIELESRYTINDNASVFAAIGHSETEFTEFVDNEEDLSGNEFALSPNFTASFGGSYYFTDEISVSGSINHQGEMFADIQNSIELDERTIVNMNVRYQVDAFDIMIYGRNLTDEFYLQSDFTDPNGGRFVTPGNPREYGVLLQVDF